MNVAILSDHGRVVGGAEKVAVGTATALHDAGFKVYLLAGDGEIDPSILERPGLRTGTLGLPNYWNRFFPAPRVQKPGLLLGDPLADSGIRKFLGGLSPRDTVVHVHAYRSKLGAGALGVPLSMGFPTVLTMHDYGYACPISTFYIYPENRICPLRGLSRECRKCQCIAPGADKLKALHVARLAGQRYRYRVPQRLRHFIAVSQFSLDILSSYLPPKAETTVLSNPVDTQDAGPADVAAHAEMLYVGRLTREKDPVTVALATREEGVPLRIAGDGPLADEVRGTHPEARMDGWVAPSATRALYRQARALVMASTWYETAGLVVLEALSQGLPVIVSDKCASREYVEDGVTGLWYDGGSAESLRAKMRLMRDGELAARMGGAAYAKFWQDPPTMQAHLTRLTGLYERMLGERR